MHLEYNPDMPLGWYDEHLMWQYTYDSEFKSESLPCTAYKLLTAIK